MSYSILDFSINYTYFVKYCDCALLESCISLILCIIKSFSKLICLILLTFPFFFLLQKHPVHDLNPECISKHPNLTIIFFHGIAYEGDDDWKQTWTTHPIDGKEECICWPQMWIPKDLNDNVKILSLSYDSNVVASVHNDVTEIGRNLIQSLVADSRCDNFLIYEHLIFHCVFQLKILECIFTSLNKLLMWNIILVCTKSWTHWREHEMGLWC